ncbi:MAG: N-acetylmuramoyl-L-alanine amidase [Oscillospiraceae bacterium]|jgi:N-acetylmuramoyl-L-alanine amidase/uncharacterized lipoprotein YddW (UPF0748 family)|nr:N-acetylmuramoyl-L-alanine amidase [Oscillospiraceae bacterium]
MFHPRQDSRHSHLKGIRPGRWWGKKSVLITAVSLALILAIAISAVTLEGRSKAISSFFAMLFTPPVSDSSQTESGVLNVTAPDSAGQPSFASAAGDSGDADTYVPFSRPDTVRGGWLVPGTDYSVQNPDTARADVEKGINAAVEYGFNTLLVPVSTEGKAIFQSSSLYTARLFDYDLFSDILRAAKAENLYVYAVVNALENADGTPLNPADASALSERASRLADFASAYLIDGVFFDGYYYNSTDFSYADYLKAGGMGVDAYKTECVTAAVSRLSGAVRGLGKSLYVGLIADPVWDTKPRDANGIEASGFTAKSDGFADTAGWLTGKIADCAVVKAYTSTEDSALPFERVAAWWAAVAETAGAPVYLSHAADKLYKEENGFKNPDQLIKQLMAAKNKQLSGSVFYSLSWLQKSVNTTALVKYLEGEIADGDILRNLVISSPEKTTFTTGESKFTVTGGSDPNFPLTLNGSPVERAQNGYFSVNLSLNPGVNTFTFAHKSKQTVFNVTYNFAVLRGDVVPAAAVNLSGGFPFQVSCSALRGATVTAALNGKTISLKAADSLINTQEKQSDDANKINPLSDFVTFIGSFDLPAETDKAQNLGQVKFTAAYNGVTGTKNGGTVTVNKASPVAPAPSPDPGIGENGLILEVIKEQGQLQENRNDANSRPTLNYVPKGTVDFCSADWQQIGEDRFKLMRSGYRMLESDNANAGAVFKVYNGTLPGANSITFNKQENTGRHTAVTFDVRWKAPFTVQLNPQNYANPYQSGSPNYSVSSLTYTYLDITFLYADSTQGKPDFEESAVFSDAQWINDGGKNVLRLNLKREGRFYGWGASYNAAGQLVFTFLNPAQTPEGRLEGTKILLDPGHGGSDSGAVGVGGKESASTLALSLKVRDKLRALGAEVVMRRESDVFMSLTGITNLIRREKPDIFISIHRNAASTTARGYENWYFYPFAKPLANYIRTECVKTFTPDRNVSQGKEYYPFFVTRVSDCPCVLTENGFIDNNLDSDIMINKNDETAQRIVDGIKNYFNWVKS